MDFPRDFKPTRVTAPWPPAGMVARSFSGSVQVLSSLQRGWQWKERYEYVSMRNPDARKLMTFIRRQRTNPEVFKIESLVCPGSGLLRNSVVSGTPTVVAKGSEDKIYTRGWGPQGKPEAGDFVEIGDSVYELFGDYVVGDSQKLSVVPSIIKYPGLNDEVITNNAKFRAVLGTDDPMPDLTSSPDYFSFDITIMEVPDA